MSSSSAGWGRQPPLQSTVSLQQPHLVPHHVPLQSLQQPHQQPHQQPLPHVQSAAYIQEESNSDVSGYTYCPPGWDEQRLRNGPDAEVISRIAMDTYTDIAYIKDKNTIQVVGETHDDVYRAQSQLNLLFFPIPVKSKKQWARPDRPGTWGQRRDSLSQGNALRRMRSEPVMAHHAAPRPALQNLTHQQISHNSYSQYNERITAIPEYDDCQYPASSSHRDYQQSAGYTARYSQNYATGTSHPNFGQVADVPNGRWT
ncbi:hypothetical protein BASA50_005358 [Batrachochytrium salamandrivorans]|uniref:K Homology domain-containing protein n=1 Tax=Batrachochytrium salamandrivorans TaxID=1357716 RepID=A0ABQ8FCR2_9FUNG|nr:hypothetical protein BASA50_005358 [Batrachochytrium salamandrivorans]KAH9273829.1 hypothetical protein BASA83_003823 [Batrachochytrium salamandrivorans]